MINQAEITLEPSSNSYGQPARGSYRLTYNGDIYAYVEMRSHGVWGPEYLFSDAMRNQLYDGTRTLRLQRQRGATDDPKVAIKKMAAELIEKGKLKGHSVLVVERTEIEEARQARRVLEAQRKQQVITRLNLELSRIDGWGHGESYRLMKATAKLLLEHERVEIEDLWPHVLAMSLEGNKA